MVTNSEHNARSISKEEEPLENKNQEANSEEEPDNKDEKRPEESASQPTAEEPVAKKEEEETPATDHSVEEELAGDEHVQEETQNETPPPVEEPKTDQRIEMQEMTAVEDMDDIGKTEEEYRHEESENLGGESGEEDRGEDERHNEEDEDHDEEDYSSYSKEDLVKAAEKLIKHENPRKAEGMLREIKRFYDEIYEAERKEALEKFKNEGGAEDDFDFRGDDLDERISVAAQAIRERKEKFVSELEKNKEQNLAAKNEVLEKLRKLVDSEETNASIGALKEIQNEWRSIGPVPNQYVKSLWANYSALMDRFYDQRSIYFELKELDRKKNLEAKLELCERAEKLEQFENLKDAIKELNELHEEFKHIGPVPRDEQEAVWKRFKGASDRVYERRKEFVENLKDRLHENLEAKLKLGDEVQEFTTFDSDKISEWNAKTKEILALQKKWEAIGGLPREKAKATNKRFWSAFKKFFNNKSAFFKRLEGQRDENLKLKEELVKKAEELKDSADWEKTANVLKNLQAEWKNIGPVPEKVRNEIYQRFKGACDEFFDRKRANAREAEKEFYENLERKEAICAEIESLAQEESSDVERVEELMDEYDEIGFVPRNAIKSIQKRFTDAVSKFADSADDLSDEDKQDLAIAAQYHKLKSSPNANRKIQRKENSIRKQISELENDISLWKNNIEFFANTDRAEKLKAEFNEKISRARKELKELKQELKVIRTI